MHAVRLPPIHHCTFHSWRPLMKNTRSDWDMWADVAALVVWLNRTNPVDDHELTLRIAKISEEAA